MKRFERAYIWLPCLMLLKDVAATVVVLFNEPGISAANVFRYHLALLPGGLIFGGTSLTWVFNLLLATALGFVLHVTSRRNQPRVAIVGGLAIVLAPVLAILLFKATRPTVDVPYFAIAVKLSPQAQNRLQNIGESVRIIAYFDGDPLPGQGRSSPPFRGVFLGTDEKLVDATNVARFEHAKVLLSDWNRLSDKNYFVTINTVSARKAAKNNLLDCTDPISVRIDSMRGKTTEVRCSLIGELGTPRPTNE